MDIWQAEAVHALYLAPGESETRSGTKEQPPGVATARPLLSLAIGKINLHHTPRACLGFRPN